MNVCHLINSFTIGGAEQTVCNLIEADDETSYTVCGLGSADDLVPTLLDSGAAVHLCRERFRFDPCAILQVRRLLESENVDVLHTHLPYAQIIGRLAAPRTGVKAIVSTHYTVQDRYHPVTRWLETATARRDAASVAVSDGVRESFSDFHPGRSWHTIYNGIPVEAFRRRVQSAPGVELSRSGPVYLNVARCIPAKSQRVLIDAMNELVPILPEARLVIVGDGPLLEQLDERIAEKGLEDNVDLVGRALPIEPYYAAADAFVLSSHVEGMPVTVLEAMAAGLPVVASDIPGVYKLVVEDETGHLVPPGDPTRLANAMISIVENDPRKMGCAGYDRVSEHFNIDRLLDSYLDLYTSVI